MCQVSKASPSVFHITEDETHPFINDENRCELLQGFDEFLAKLSVPLLDTGMTFGFVDQLPALSSVCSMAHHNVLALFTASVCIVASGFSRKAT